MIGFVKLSIPILYELRDLGFNILRSASEVGHPDPSWVPDRVNLDIYFDPYNSKIYRNRMPLIKRQILFIDDAITSNNYENLKGHVFYIYKGN